MRYLLDTHTFLWYFADSNSLSETAANIMEDEYLQKYVSMASLWEFSIKLSMGKLQFEGGLSQLLNIMTQNGFVIWPITQSHLMGIINLPFIHRDPFDRLIVATAKMDGMTIVTVDENIYKYGVSCVW